MPSIDITNYPTTVARFGGNEQRATVFLDRYAKKGADGNPVEFTPEEMWDRVATAIARVEDPEQRVKFRRLLDDFKFVPGGRILAGAGVDAEVTYYNCYVIPVETRQRRQLRQADAPVFSNIVDPGSDSREAIFDTIGLMVDIMSRGGGVGINWSVLRPKGAYLKRVNGTTSGPVSWMDVASRAVGTVEQGGSRRGAAMFMLDVWHPDVVEFIDAKRDFSLITNANVSVGITDPFMEAVEKDTVWVFGFPDTSHPAYNSEWEGDIRAWAQKGYPVVEYGEMSARELWFKMVKAAHASGEPGIVFMDRYNKLSVANYAMDGAASVERIISVNPCGEQGLGPYSVCNLGSMNLAKYVRPSRHSTKSVFDWTAFSADCADAIEFLDRVVDENYYFLPENQKVQELLRRVGLGVMGLADALIALGLRYGSGEAVEFTEKVFKTMKFAAVSRSTFLAERLGHAPGWDKSMARAPYYAEYWDTAVGERLVRYGMRNMYVLTQAPTGTTSILAGVNSGIEPYFAFEYTRKDRTGVHKVVHPIAEKLRDKDRHYWPDFYVESGQVPVSEHIAMQAAAQRHIDSSVSKTINGPNSHTEKDVSDAYWTAWEHGLKGIAYFRDGSGRDQVLYKEEPKVEEEKAEKFHHIDWCQSTGPYGALDCDCPETDREGVLMAKYEALQRELAELAPYAVDFHRPAALSGVTRKVATKHGSAYVTVNRDDSGRPVEVFFNIGKAGDDVMAMGEALGRLASLALRHGASLGGVAHQLEGVGGQTKIAFQKSVPHAISEALTSLNRENDDSDIEALEAVLPAEAVIPQVVKEFVEDTLLAPVPTVEELKKVTTVRKKPSHNYVCPDCGQATVVLEEGCKKCVNCGWSAC